MNIIHCAANHRFTTMAAKKLIYPAADRNKDAILSVLKEYIQHGPDKLLLEISSGSGQHVAHFAPHFPHITFYPSEYNPKLLESIAAHSSCFSNVKDPMLIDISTDFQTWGNGAFQAKCLDYMYCANLIHISPYKCTIGLFENAGKLLKQDGLLFTYGAYAHNGIITPESNVRFDESLRSQDPEWGLRDIKDLEVLARKNGMKLLDMRSMPANNKTLIWAKCSD